MTKISLLSAGYALTDSCLRARTHCVFNGLIRRIGTVVAANALRDGLSLLISCHDGLEGRGVGDSIAVDGCCLTITSAKEDRVFTFDAATETVKRTSISRLKGGEKVHLEPAITLATPIDGHLITGHVDGLATLKKRWESGSALYLEFEVPNELTPYLAPRGSVALMGVSLTIVEQKGECIIISLVPHTQGVTLLPQLIQGKQVNLEVDILARYVAHQRGRSSFESAGVGLELLNRAGFR